MDTRGSTPSKSSIATPRLARFMRVRATCSCRLLRRLCCGSAVKTGRRSGTLAAQGFERMMMRYRIPFNIVLGLGFGASAIPALAQRSSKPPRQPRPASESLTVQEQLDRWFQRARRVAFGEWGIAVGDQQGRLIWGIQPTKPLIPASTVKLLTTGFARSVLG